MGRRRHGGGVARQGGWPLPIRWGHGIGCGALLVSMTKLNVHCVVRVAGDDVQANYFPGGGVLNVGVEKGEGLECKTVVGEDSREEDLWEGGGRGVDGNKEGAAEKGGDGGEDVWKKLE